jgi:hypothetical protein
MAEVQKSVQSGELSQRFIEFVMMHSQNAALFLGQIPNPKTGEGEVNLELAKMFIDQLAMIQEKTRGNLTNEETTVLRNALSNLQMAYVEVAREAPPKAPRNRSNLRRHQNRRNNHRQVRPSHRRRLVRPNRRRSRRRNLPKATGRSYHHPLYWGSVTPAIRSDSCFPDWILIRLFAKIIHMTHFRAIFRPITELGRKIPYRPC